MTGYIFFFITTFLYVSLSLFTTSKPYMSGDNAMGYGLGLILLSLAFALSSLLLAIVVRSKGGFDWVAQEVGTRTALVFIFWLSMALTTFFCAIFKMEWHEEGTYPQFLRWLALSQGQLWIPLLWLIACFFSLNPDWQSTGSLPVLTLSFWVGLSISTFFSGGLLVGYIRDSAQQTEAELASQIRREDQVHQQALNEIAAHKPDDPLINLLNYASRFQRDDVRKAALVKIKAYPDWEAQLLDLLTNKRGDREVYYFLDGNRVDHPEKFAEPLNQSLFRLSASINADIAVSDNLQSWSIDMYGIDQLLRAVDEQFLNQGVDFYPNVLKLKQVLNTPLPERFKGVRFSITDVVDAWLSQHKR